MYNIIWKESKFNLDKLDTWDIRQEKLKTKMHILLQINHWSCLRFFSFISNHSLQVAFFFPLYSHINSSVDQIFYYDPSVTRRLISQSTSVLKLKQVGKIKYYDEEKRDCWIYMFQLKLQTLCVSFLCPSWSISLFV